MIPSISTNSVNPDTIFANNEMSLRDIEIYGFDYDYTLAFYSSHLHTLIFNIARDILITKHRVCICVSPYTDRIFVLVETDLSALFLINYRTWQYTTTYVFKMMSVIIRRHLIFIWHVKFLNSLQMSYSTAHTVGGLTSSVLLSTYDSFCVLVSRGFAKVRVYS